MGFVNVINHRHDSELDCVQTIRDGDYAQQWGVDGTDTSPQTNLIENNELSAIIQDRGNDIKAFLASYKDHSRRVPKLADGTPVTENVINNAGTHNRASSRGRKSCA